MELNKQIVSALAKKLNVKAEELTSVLTAEEETDAVKGVKSKVDGLQVFSEEQLTTRITNERNEAKSEGFKEGAINAYEKGEKIIAEKFGVQKKSDSEKLPELIERAIGEKTSTKPSEELKRLQEQLSEKDTALQNALSNLETTKSEFEQKEKQLVVDSRISELVSGLPIDADENLLPAQREFVKFQLKNKYDVDQSDGRLIFKDKATGKEIKNPVTADYKDPSEVIKEFAPSVVKLKEAKVPKNGTGLKDTAISKQGLDGINFADYPTAEALEEHLIKSGHAPHEPKVQEIIGKYLASDMGAQQRKATQIDY